MNAVVALESRNGERTPIIPSPAIAWVVIAADVPLDHIEVKPDFNPRKRFHAKSLADLIANVCTVGVLQSIAIRTQPGNPDRYWVIAGERRWRAACAAGLATIPCRIFQGVSERDAMRIAALENGQREDLSPGEEALDAHRMMIACDGNRTEAALQLGWEEPKFDSRLLLSRASELVLMALAEKRISLGHAQLLSPLPELTQNGTLEEVIKRSISVEELHLKLDAFALDLATARFDQAGCRGCPHNTTQQASLFEQNIGEGRCTNRPCFQNKTLDYLAELRVGLREEHNAVHLDTEREPGTYTLLLKRDVGSQQFAEGCAQCEHFGCLISSKPGEAGKITTELCFNLSCREQKMAAYQAVLPSPATDDIDGTDSTGNRPTPGGAIEAAKKKTTTRRSGRASAAGAPKPVQDAIHAIQRRAAATEIERNAKMVQAYAVLALLNELHMVRNDHDNADPLTKRGVSRASSGDSRLTLISALYALDTTVLTDLTAELAGRVATHTSSQSYASTDYLKGAQITLRVLGVDLASHFVLNADFLNVHTKAAIEGLMREAGFDKHCNRLDRNAFKRLMSRKHAEIIKEITTSGFDFKGFVPQSVEVPAK